MKFKIEAPEGLDASKEIDDAGNLVVTPMLVRNQHVVKVGYVSAHGDGGAESRAIVLFNGNTGEFSLQKINQTVKFAFDKPVEEFKRRRATARDNGKKGAVKRSQSQDTNPAKVTNGTPDQNVSP